MVGQTDESNVLAADVPVNIHVDIPGISEVPHLQHHAAALEHLDALDEGGRGIRHMQHNVRTSPTSHLHDLVDALLGG